MTGLLKGRITRWSMLAAVLVVAGLSVAWNGECQYHLGGAWIGSGGTLWNGLHIPLDPAGRTAAVRIHTLSYGADVAGLLAYFGADAVTDWVGQSEMISRDTAKYTLVCYAIKQGNPPVVGAIFVMSGPSKFTGPNTYVVTYNIDVYLPSADADGDGFPDPGTTPVLSIPGTTTGKRVLP